MKGDEFTTLLRDMKAVYGKSKVGMVLLADLTDETFELVRSEKV